MLERGDLVAGRYLIERLVASGGMGRVFQCVDQSDGRAVALKVLSSHKGDGAARFARECSILARVGHPGLVRHLEHGVERDGTLWLAMEWLEGEDLAGLLGRRRGQVASTSVGSEVSEQGGDSTVALPLADAMSAPTTQIEVQRVLSVEEVIVLLRRVAGALAVLHAEGIMHRDLKPGNLFLVGGQPGLARLIDLGTARSTEAVSDLTGPGVLIGTPFYMAPEQARAEGLLGTAVDVWALGCIAYECLVGRPPFAGGHVLAVFARILVDEPAPLRVLRPEVPPALAGLIEAMLAKDPAARPRCAALVASLEELSDAAWPAELDASPRSVIGGAERRVRCLLLARVPGFVGADEALRDALERASARVDPLAEGALLVTLRSRSAPGDQALSLARVALALQASAPQAACALTTGQSEERERASVGPLAARAASLLAAASAGEFLLDEASAALLEGRFLVERGATSRLLGEHSTEQARTLLGRPTQTVGRRRELAQLLATWEDCSQEPRSRAVLVTAGPGVGKSRLRAEFVRAVERQDQPFTRLLGQGDSLRAGSPFVMIAPALRRLAGVVDGASAAQRHQQLRGYLGALFEGATLDQVAGFLGEMIGAPVSDEAASDALRAARNDPMLLSEQLSAAFLSWLRAETQRAPVFFIVEDLHWGDRPSVRLLDAALQSLPGSPLMILVMARPEVLEIFPDIFAGRPLDTLRLEPLTRKASLELARDVLGAEFPEERLAAVVDRAAGNALYLEELLRAVVEGSDAALPDTVIGMVQARLDALGADACRLLRAASVFGEVFSEGGVRALVGAVGSSYDVSEWLDDLTRRELISLLPAPAGAPERSFRFRHALVRDGAYATFTEHDRALAHRLACSWLEEAGEQDALSLASHAERGGEPARAVRLLRRAAEQALEGNDLPGVIAAGRRALAHGVQGQEHGEVLAFMATAAYWQSLYREAADRGREALALLSPSSALWLNASGSTLVSLARLGDFDAFDPLFAGVRSTHAARGAEAAQIVALCRGTFQLIFKGRFDEADATLARIAAIQAEAGELDALTLAQASHVRGVRSAMVGDVGPFLVNLERAVEFFDRAGDVRNVSLERSTVGWCYVEIGQFAHATEVLRKNLARCQELRSQQAITYAKANLGYALASAPDHHAEARLVLAEAIAETRSVANRRLEGWSRGYLVPVLRAAGEHEAEEREAREACELLASAPGLLAWTLAQRARALLALGRAADALPVAREAMAILERLGGLLQGESLPPLVLAEALRACGDLPAAHLAARDAVARLERRAARLPHASWRESFLAIDDNQLTLRLAVG